MDCDGNRIAALEATLSDSTRSDIGIEIARAFLRISSDTPAPSLPKTSTASRAGGSVTSPCMSA
jgi:hypothetical protein